MKNGSPALVLLLAASIFAGLAQIVLRWGGKQAVAYSTHGAMQWLWGSRWWALGLLLSWLCGLGYAWSLRRIDLYLAMPLYTGLVYVVSVAGSVLLLREVMAPVQIAGMVFIFTGVLLLSMH
jgi:multidrug transporter EmrE-like cation transporter